MVAVSCKVIGYAQVPWLCPSPLPKSHEYLHGFLFQIQNILFFGKYFFKFIIENDRFLETTDTVERS